MACPAGATAHDQCIAYEVPGYVSMSAYRDAALRTASTLAHAQESSGVDPSDAPYQVRYACVTSPETREAAFADLFFPFAPADNPWCFAA